MEKERYEYIHNDEIGDGLLDIKNNNEIYDIEQMSDLLNQQDARIKELELENGYIIFADGYDENGNEVNKQVYTTYKSKCDELIKENQQLKKENKNLKEMISTQLNNNADNVDFIENQRKEIEQLKQSQTQKAIDELEKVREWIKSLDESGYIFQFRDMNTRERFNQKLDNQIIELRSE